MIRASNPVGLDVELDRRFDYHRPSGVAQDIHQSIRIEVKAFARKISRLLPVGREQSLFLTALEEASFWAHAAVARDPSLHEESDGPAADE